MRIDEVFGVIGWGIDVFGREGKQVGVKAVLQELVGFAVLHQLPGPHSSILLKSTKWSVTRRLLILQADFVLLITDPNQ